MSVETSSQVTVSGRLALVTGAGRGLGRAYARALARQGARVIVHDAGLDKDGHNPDRTVATAVVEEIQAAGGHAYSAHDDLAVRGAVARLIERLTSRHGRIDILIHNAGLAIRAELSGLDRRQWALSRSVNGEAALWLLQSALPGMVEAGFGRVVLTLTGHALSPSRADPHNLVAYASAKAMQFGLMNALAGPLAEHNVLINAISPVAATRMFTQTVASDLSPEAVAPAVVYLASEECRIWGTVVRAAGGQFSIGRYAVTSGVRLEPDQLSAETIAARWSEIASGPFHTA